MPSHDLLRMLRWDAEKAANDSGFRNPRLLKQKLQGDHWARMGAVLSEMGDSYFGQGWGDFVRLADQLDFALLRWEPYYLNGPCEQRIWIHARGGLLIADSYNGMVNQAHLWCCWKPFHQNQEEWPPGILREDFQDGFWSGCVDASEGLQTRWQALIEQGKLISPWPVALLPDPFHAAEARSNPSREEILARLFSWPAAARRLIGIS